MKKNSKKILSLGMLVITAGALVAPTVLAAEYPSATEATGKGTVKFVEGDEPVIIDPIDPITPVIPVEPGKPNPNKGDLVIQYVSDFDFGTHQNDLSAFTGNALADKVQTINEDGSVGEIREVPSFVSTKDMRIAGKGWELKVTATPFTTGTNELNGAEVSLSNLAYNGTGANLPTAQAGIVKLVPGTTVSVAKATEGKGIGYHSLAMGEVDEGKTSGVTLNIPANTMKDTTTDYSADFNWELVADPTM